MDFGYDYTLKNFMRHKFAIMCSSEGESKLLGWYLASHGVKAEYKDHPKGLAEIRKFYYPMEVIELSEFQIDEEPNAKPSIMVPTWQSVKGAKPKRRVKRLVHKSRLHNS